jgi:peptide/nickel transport system ATP-binding protein
MSVDESHPVLAIEDLEVRYRTGKTEVIAVSDLSLTLRAGGSLGLVGESGCGKSTIAMAITRYLGSRGRISKGRILFRGEDLRAMDKRTLQNLRARRIAMIYQDASTALNPTMTLGGQLAEVLELQGMSDAATVRATLVDMLTSVGIPDPAGTLTRYPHQISGGQQQRVVIAMAFLSKPELLILDEPTTALDVTVEAEIMTLLAEMRVRHGTTMLFISHNLGLVSRVCDEVAVMYAGQVVEHGPTRQVLREPRHPYSRGLIACLPRLDAGRDSYRLASIPGQVPRLETPPQACTFFDRCEFATAGCKRFIPLEPMSGGGSIRCARWTEIEPDIAKPGPIADAAKLPESSQPVLSLDRISKTYELRKFLDLSGRRAVRIPANREVSLDLQPGETLGIVGESGCGKSTLARIIMGLDMASGGRVVLLGEDVTSRTVELRNREQVRNVQMIFQNPDSTLNPSHTVGFILDRAVRKLGMVGGKAARQAEVDRLLDLVRLPRTVAQTTASRLSGGQKQRVAVARAFAGQPALVVADEPTSALDTSVKTAILELLLSVQRDSGTSLVFISHDLAVVRYIADRVGVMYLGRVVEIGRADEVFAPPYHPYTKALLEAVPSLDPDVVQHRLVLQDEAGKPSPALGCPFAPRCTHAIEGVCAEIEPPLRESLPGHVIRCHLTLDQLRSAAGDLPPAKIEDQRKFISQESSR